MVWRNLGVAYRSVGDLEKSQEYLDKWAKWQNR